MSEQSRFRSGVWMALFVLVLFGASSTMADPTGDPSERVARLSYIHGGVSFLPAGESEWGDAIVNRPLVTGDKLYTYREARAELDVGAATLRLNDLSGFSLVNLDDQTVQIELTQGTINLRVRKLASDQTYEIDTPTLAFVVSQPGEYRIDIGSRDEATRVTVFSGSGVVYGDGDTSMNVDERHSYRFPDASLRDDGIRDLPRADDFDSWCQARADRHRNSVTRRYVSDEVIGSADLDEYGSWDNEPNYGPIWYPTRVSGDWAPYRSGHWAWIDPWGWNWVDDEPWGFAPFHYGRWARVGHRWGWIPGPMERRPVYAPALVLFIGGHNLGIGITAGGGPVGWAPLGPRDVYMPPYRVSRGYFSNVNVSNIRNKTVINNTNITNIYNNYAAGRPTGKGNDTYSRHADAVTVVSRDTFAHARPVAAERVHVKREQLQRAEVVHNVEVAPTRASLVPEKSRRTHGEGQPPEVGTRKVVTHAAPPPRPAPLEERLKMREHGAGRPRAEDAAPKAPQRPQDGQEAAGRQPVPSAENMRDKHKAPRQERGAQPEAASPAVTPEPAVDQGRAREQRRPLRVQRAPERQVEPPVQVERQPQPASPAGTPEPAVDQGGAREQRRPSRFRRAPERQVEPPVQVERQPAPASPAGTPEPAVDQGGAREQRRPSRVQRAPERQVEPPAQVERQPQPAASPAVTPEPAVDQGRDREQRRPSRVQRAPERQVDTPVPVERREPAPERAIRREAPPPPAAVEPQPPAREERRHAPPEARPAEGRAPQAENAPAPPDKRKKHEKDCTGKDANDPECVADRQGRGRGR